MSVTYTVTLSALEDEYFLGFLVQDDNKSRDNARKIESAFFKDIASAAHEFHRLNIKINNKIQPKTAKSTSAIHNEKQIVFQ